MKKIPNKVLLLDCFIHMYMYMYIDFEQLLKTSLLYFLSVDERTEFDFQGLRLDWFRLQALTSVYKAPLK